MRLIIAKIIISCLLCYQGFILLSQGVSGQAIRKVLVLNVQELNVQQRNMQFLKKYLHRIVAFCFFVSVVVVFSKNLLPKALTIIGIILWMYFGIHPQLQQNFKIIQRCEYMAIAGGLIYMGGVQFFQKNLSFFDLRQNNVQRLGDKQE